jgi:hypothetical protein
MIKLDWLAAVDLIRKVCAVRTCHSSPELAYNSRIVPANGKKELVADEIFQALLTNN